MSDLLTFGTPPSDTEYITRPGAYAIFFNSAQELGLVRTDDQRYFLAGGGIESGEDKEEALLREVLEETGLLATVEAPVGMAREFYLDEIESRYYEKIGHFYRVSITGQDPVGKIEEDHTLLWMPVAQAMPLLFHDMYRWAVAHAQR
ncbi:MAG: NUDIX domain-containing protein [Phaeodactylibacter sp.]|uniref:NUDIX domain-containing protein n=1 Tax=Phaeodactylibacter sp. TaxID=1940289 RepID=UPI0032EBA9D0